MSHFYGDLQGNRGEATRQGSATSGIRAHVRGWNLGVYVYCYVDKDGRDRVGISLTSGSNGHKSSKQIGDYGEEDL